MPVSRFAAWAGNSAKIEVTGVTEVTETQNPKLSAGLGNTVEVTRAGEAAVTGVTSPAAALVTAVTEGATPRLPAKRQLDQCGNQGNPRHPSSKMGCVWEALADDPGAWRDFYEERAAIIEYDSGVSRLWAEGFARLHPDHPPPDVPVTRWQTFIDDIGRFLDGGFAERAAELGWGPLDLFGADRDRPFARIDQQGLLWLIAGNDLIALSHDTATIETSSCARQTYRRKPNAPGRVLAWEMVQ
jgi:hypothetical protein